MCTGTLKMSNVEAYQRFVEQHRIQLEQIPGHFWEALYYKVSNEIFDAGNSFQLMYIDYTEETEEEEEVEPTDVTEFRPTFTLVAVHDLDAAEPENIYLIDHAWTFRIGNIKAQLSQDENLMNRMCIIMGVDQENKSQETLVKIIMERLWNYCDTYSVASDSLEVEQRLPIWYIMDEVGSAINHSDEPNCRIVPFYYLDKAITYSLVFPTSSISEGDQITRDFVAQIPRSDETIRSALLLPWIPVDFTDVDCKQIEPDAEYFKQGHIDESYISDLSKIQLKEPTVPLRVYTKYEPLLKCLTANEFVLVENPEDANILWLHEHFKNYEQLALESPHKFINQFPFEYVLTLKDLLPVVCRRIEQFPAWLPTTFNLKTELVKFISYYQQSVAKNLDNHWIIKPWNLARSLDQTITNNLKQIVRLSTTGPKIIQKYINDPVLFRRADLNISVKFDVRYVFLLKSVQPLEAYIYKNFFLRFAREQFSLDDFENYEKHFTVMNYRDDAEESLLHIKCKDFLEQYWPQQYPTHPWENVENNIIKMLHEILKCSIERQPPCGIAANPQSRALYATDIMLEWENGQIQPKVLEINWAPDCQRACDYYPDFYNDIFKLLFLDIQNENVFKAIK